MHVTVVKKFYTSRSELADEHYFHFDLPNVTVATRVATRVGQGH